MIVINLDRDGVINHNNRSKLDGPYYTLKPDQFIWFEGSLEAIIKIQKLGYKIHIVTSQNCISEGLVTVEEVDQIHDKMNQDIIDAGGEEITVSTIYGVKEDSRARAEAKAQAIIDFCKENKVLDLSKCYMVGDTEGDIIAGRLASNTTVHVELDYTSESDKYVPSADIHVKSLLEFVDKLPRS
jgi:D-glycero-D-manno-heptose 1,7-bisphosphate phosphatase